MVVTCVFEHPKQAGAQYRLRTYLTLIRVAAPSSSTKLERTSLTVPASIRIHLRVLNSTSPLWTPDSNPSGTVLAFAFKAASFALSSCQVCPGSTTCRNWHQAPSDPLTECQDHTFFSRPQTATHLSRVTSHCQHGPAPPSWPQKTPQRPSDLGPSPKVPNVRLQR